MAATAGRCSPAASGVAASAGRCSPAASGMAASAGRCSPAASEAAAPAGSGVSAAQPPSGPDPLGELLRSLRGQQVTLQVGERLVTGKLITTDPIMIVGPAGEATMVAPGVVKSVQF